MGNKRKASKGATSHRHPGAKPKPRHPVKPSLKQPAIQPDRPADVVQLDENYVHYESASDGDEIQPLADAKRQRRPPSKKQLRKGAVSDFRDTDGGHRGGDGNSDDESDDDESDGSESDDGDDMMAEPEMTLNDREQNGNESDVDVTLDFYDPRDDDVTSVAAFLAAWERRCAALVTTSSKKKKKIASSGSVAVSAISIAEAVCAQTRVGTTVRVEDGEAPVGFISCLNVRRHADVLEALRAALLRRGGGVEGGIAKLVESCFGGRGRFEKEKMGLILCERVVNLPPLVVPKLLEALFCEIEWAVEDEPTQELREDYRFGWYLYLTEAYMVPAGEGDEGEAEEQVGFVKVEDEAWFKHATHHVTWTLPEAEVEKGGLQRNGMAMIIAASQVDSVRKTVEELVGFIDTPGDDGVVDADADSGNKET